MTHIERALAESLSALRPHADTCDWSSLPAGPPQQRMEWSCWETAAHVAHDLAAYAGQLAALPDDDYLPFDLVVRPGTPPREVLRVIEAAGGMLTGVLATSGPDARAFHWGPCDPTGFEAMGVAETLLHTYDITRGLGAAWSLPARSAAYVLDRLFPDAPSGDPAEVLLWSTGRGELPGHKRLTEWVWQAAREG